MTTPSGDTPSQPDNDTVDDGTHGGEPESEAAGRTPHSEDPAEG